MKTLSLSIKQVPAGAWRRARTALLALAWLGAVLPGALPAWLCAADGPSIAPKAPPPKPPDPSKVARGRLSANAQRNENAPIYQVDNNALQEAMKRLGTNLVIVSEFLPDRGHYAREFGQPASGIFLLSKPAPVSGVHGEAYWMHQNSIFNARTFFQVGGVKPSRQNHFGGRFTTPAARMGYLTGNVAQRKIRGMVNGNVLVPLENERTPLATDPAKRLIVQRWLDAFPNDPPNRTEIDPRALNTNAPQRIDATDADLRLDRTWGAKDALALFYFNSRQRIRLFQFVAGQNPDTDIHSHRARITHRHAFSAATELTAGGEFHRIRSSLVPEPNAPGPRVRFGFQIQELGPDSQFPIDRAQNVFTGGAALQHVAAGGRHTLMAGGNLLRTQLNGVESINLRGYWQFTNNFGRPALMNFLLGEPSKYEVIVGDAYRAFRNWHADLFIGDRWRLNPRFQMLVGLRYGLETRPQEARGINQIPYDCDCNNFSPHLGIVADLKQGVILRSNYTVTFGQIFPVTYQQIRNNLPELKQIQVQNPDLLNPLNGIDLNNRNVRNSPLWLSPDLVAPYSHQYNLTLERRLKGKYLLRAGYLGSRTFKLFSTYITNRALVIPGVPTALETVDARRPDPRYYEINQVANGGFALLNGGQVTLDAPLMKGFAWSVSYTFSKAIDTGVDYSSTAANDDLTRGRSQYQYEMVKDRKGLSNFDSPHAFLATYSYEFPRMLGPTPWASFLLDGWQVSGTILTKKGTPFTLYVGSDSPGYGNVDGSASDRPNILDPSILGMTVGHPDTAPLILRRDRFSFIGNDENQGNLGRNTFRKAPINNLNLALSKQWRLAGSREWLVVLRGEAYNLTNTPQFDEPQRNLSSPSFGKITNTLNDGRVLQFVLRLVL